MARTRSAALRQWCARPWKALAACVTLALIAACGGGSGGGGGSEDQACASKAFVFTSSWTVSGGTFQPSNASMIVGRVGVPLRARPEHTGVPAGCEGEGTYALWEAEFPLPAGLVLDAGTGEIRGTPTAATTASGGGHGVVWVEFPGFTRSRVLHTVWIQP